MTDENQTPEVTPTEPLPPVAEAAVPEGQAPPMEPAVPVYAEQPAQSAPHPKHTHQMSDTAIAFTIIGAVVLALLSFGFGWGARSAVAHVQLQRAAMMGYGAGQGGFGGGQGFGEGRDFGHRRGMMGGDHGYCQGQGQGYGYSQDPGYGQTPGVPGYGQGWGYGHRQGMMGGSLPTSTPQPN